MHQPVPASTQHPPFTPATMQDLQKQYRQGNIYFLRNGSPGDCYKAITCLHGPACAHYGEAQYKLAFSYERLHKQTNALHWYIKGAAHGDQRCMYRAALILAKRGHPGPARYYFDKLAQLGWERGYLELQKLDTVPYKYTAALENAYHGEPEALFWLGCWYACKVADGLDKHGERTFALNKLKQAAQLGHKNAASLYQAIEKYEPGKRRQHLKIVKSN